MFTIFQRLAEPSTYAGIAPVFLSLGLFGFDDAMWKAIFAALAAIFGVVAMVMKEKGPAA